MLKDQGTRLARGSIGGSKELTVFRASHMKCICTHEKGPWSKSKCPKIIPINSKPTAAAESRDNKARKRQDVSAHPSRTQAFKSNVTPRWRKGGAFHYIKIKMTILRWYFVSKMRLFWWLKKNKNKSRIAKELSEISCGRECSLGCWALAQSYWFISFSIEHRGRLSVLISGFNQTSLRTKEIPENQCYCLTKASQIPPYYDLVLGWLKISISLYI